MCTCSCVVGGAGWTGCWAVTWPLLLLASDGPKHEARWANRRRFTEVSSPGYLPTSLAHSVKPARNLLTTVGSADAVRATACRWRFSICFTAISRISAFSSFECLEGCNREEHIGDYVTGRSAVEATAYQFVRSKIEQKILEN